jgi:ABC-type dipeptide/oligopeptide/nickel transport system ATPase subunit
MPVGGDTFVAARGLSVMGHWGSVFGPIDLDIPRGGLNVLVGPSGSSCTALLLSLAGRMVPSSGTVSASDTTAELRTLAAIAAVDDVDALDHFMTVGELITEQLRWSSPWYRLVPRVRQDTAAAVCGPVFGPIELPSIRSHIGKLTELESVLLRIALVNIRPRPLLVVGSLDQLPELEARDVLLSRLGHLGTSQTVVTASANPVDSEHVSAQIRLGTAVEWEGAQ